MGLRLTGAELGRHLAHELDDDVAHRDQACGPAVLVEHDGDLLLLATELAEQLRREAVSRGRSGTGRKRSLRLQVASSPRESAARISWA
jgi:hypothetical protein